MFEDLSIDQHEEQQAIKPLKLIPGPTRQMSGLEKIQGRRRKTQNFPKYCKKLNIIAVIPPHVVKANDCLSPKFLQHILHKYLMRQLFCFCNKVIWHTNMKTPKTIVDD